MLYIVTYDARKERDITPLLEELKNSDGWAHYLDNTWFISTEETAAQLFARIKPLLEGDRAIVLQIMPRADSEGWLPRKGWDWLERHGHS